MCVEVRTVLQHWQDRGHGRIHEATQLKHERGRVTELYQQTVKTFGFATLSSVLVLTCDAEIKVLA